MCVAMGLPPDTAGSVTGWLVRRQPTLRGPLSAVCRMNKRERGARACLCSAVFLCLCLSWSCDLHPCLSMHRQHVSLQGGAATVTGFDLGPHSAEKSQYFTLHVSNNYSFAAVATPLDCVCWRCEGGRARDLLRSLPLYQAQLLKLLQLLQAQGPLLLRPLHQWQ